jgi:cysteine desulfurase/selenocysteine lyase
LAPTRVQPDQILMNLDNEINRLRDDTPGCRDLVHFNNAGFSLSPSVVVESVIAHLRLEQQAGGYEAAELAAGKVDNFYRALSRMLNCQPKEIAYVENATRAWDMVFYAIPFQKGDQVITGQAEYASNYLAMLQLQKRLGIDIVVVPNCEAGTICLDTLTQSLTEKCKLIALTHIPSQVGTVQPAEEVGKIAKVHGILYLLDACQSAGQVPLDTQKLQCDLLTGTGRKYMRGPRGTGFLYASNDVLERLEPPFIDLHSAQWIDENSYRFRDDARRFENWESFVAGKIGLGVAADYACELGLENIRNRIQQLATLLVSKLTEIPAVTVHERQDNLSGIVTFSKVDEDAAALQRRLRDAAINTSVSKRGNAVLDAKRRGVGDVNRASLHYYNTEAEIDRFVDEIVRSQA